MQQLTQNLKDGNMEILEVPFPALNKGQVLVRNHYSVISVGTEGKTVSDARKGYIAKARTRQKELKQVIDMIKTSGIINTYKMVMNKLEAPSPLGYSCVGEVIALGEGINDLKVGDYVACGGQGAYHADVVAVYRNLCVKVPETVNLKHAAFTTIAAIAMQGIRQADLRLGENCVIIGLGLIGQITAQLLNAAGIKVIGIDINQEQVETSIKNGINLAFNRNLDGIEKIITDYTDGNGTDAVIITAGSSSTDPVDFAGTICRKKGKVIVVGAVPTGFSREKYYKKELELKMSCSYGPGRYDSIYEEKNVDYPIGYVRWTENRNMKTFIDLLAQNKLNIEPLITHTYKLEDADEAYNMILKKTEKFSGILISYDTEKTLKKEIILNSEPANPSEPNIGLIGAGSFAQNVLLPKMKGLGNMIGVATSKGTTAKYVADKYGFAFCSDKADDIIDNEKINTVFIFTRHNLHAKYVISGIEQNKNVFVEKPLAMNREELEKIKEAYLNSNYTGRLMVGFNRRFAPQVEEIKHMFLKDQPKSINIRINAGSVPKESWVNDPEIGGGRIIGEGCHFIDLAAYIAGSKVKSVSANNITDPNFLYDTVVINLAFENGSIATVSYFSNGNKLVPKEYIEVFCNNRVVIVEDFIHMTDYSKSIRKSKLSSQDKGHAKEVIAFTESIKEGKPSPILFDELYNSTLATFAVIESCKTNRIIEL